MSNKIYFCGFRLEHFKGWNGSGDPSYSAVSSSDTSSYNSVGSITLGSSSDVVWGDVNSDNNSSLYVLWYLNSSSGYDSNLVLIDSSNNALEIISTNTTISVSYGTYDSTSNSIDNLTSLISITVSSQTRPFISVILDYDGTSGKYNNIRIFSSIDGYNPETKVLEAKLKTSMINIQSLYSSYVTNNSNLYYIVVTNFDSRSGYLDYTEANAVGSVSGWTGDVSTFATYPVEYDTINYTNGYSGSYSVSIPKYLASGSGISYSLYINSSQTDSFNLEKNAGDQYDRPTLVINNNYGSSTTGYITYAQLIGGGRNMTNTSAPVISFNEWINISLFNTGTELNILHNGNIVASTTSIESLTNFNFSINLNQNIILAGIAYTKSATVNYPFDQDPNAISYIDFADPNNPVVYGDTTQFSITSQNLTSVTPISNLPKILINSEIDEQHAIPLSGGQYCISPNQSVSYKLSKTLNTTTSGTQPMATILSSPMISTGACDVSPFVKFSNGYTNGYSGSYNISVPNNPVVYGDTTQFSITSQNLTSVTPISNIPSIQITSTNTNYNGYLTTSDSLPVSTTGGNEMFFLYDNPVTNSSWTSSTIQNYQFGLTKIN